MKELIHRIEDRAAAVNEHPFLRWLDDDTVPAAERLGSWLPAAAFFVFGFRDLNAEVLPYPPSESAECPFRQAINKHLQEDATHWGWYLRDLQLLRLDDEIPFSQALRRLWSDEHAEQRRAVYRLCALAAEAHEPALRFALVSALEAVAHRLFAKVQRVAQLHEDETGVELSYLGRKHLDREPGHLTQQAEADVDLFLSLPLDDLQSVRAWAIAEKVIAIVEARWHEFHRVALARVRTTERAAA